MNVHRRTRGMRGTGTMNSLSVHSAFSVVNPSQLFLSVAMSITNRYFTSLFNMRS